MKKTAENDIDVKVKNKMFAKIERCKMDLKNDPTNPQLHEKMGDLYLQWHLDIYNAGQYIDDAITEYQMAMESLLDSHEIYYKLGVAFYHKGELDKAIKYLTTAIEKKNNYYEAYYMLSETFVKKAHFTDAYDAAEAATICSRFGSSSAHYMMYKLIDASSIKSFRTKLKSLYERVLSLILMPFDKIARENLARNLSYLKFLPLFLKS